jgi:NADH-quinone oxidoreductase subunit M
MLGITGIIFTALTALRQIDIKRIIAYSSISHMNLIVLGLFSKTTIGIDGSVYLMLGHGIVSTALFFCVGILYDRYHTRIIYYYGGLSQIMPNFAFFFFFFSFANMGFPGTINFIGEFLILISIIHNNIVCGFLSATSTVLSAAYSVYILNRINFGTIKIYLSLKDVLDITPIEFWILSVLSIITL